MKKIPLIDLIVHYERLENGLEVYLIPKKGNNIYATYNTKFGGKDIEFVPIGENKMIEFPAGIAHFLEHKMFEEEDGKNIFSFFAENGTNANANTSYERTSYLFSGPDFFEENLKCLLDYVQNPYFTEENVEKEKGIIIQELNMINDSPYNRMYLDTLAIIFNELPYKKSLIGTKESINSITKEDLYRCYNTFYHPSNMFIVISGNIDPDKTMDLIKENQSQRNLNMAQKVKFKQYNEKDKVAKKSLKIKMNVTVPKVEIGYKINVEKLKDMDRLKLLFIINNIFELKLGSTSILSEQLRDEKVITEPLYIASLDMKKHIIMLIISESENSKELFKKINNELKDLNITASELERKKKAAISAIIKVYDNVPGINYRIVENKTNYNNIYENEIDIIKNVTIDDVKEVIDHIDLTNQFTYEIEPK